MTRSEQNPTDAELVRAVRRGDQTAFAGLVDRHLAAVHGVARRITGHAADAEDIAQDAFLRAFEKLDGFDMRRSFRNWLLKVTTNLALNHLRAAKRERIARQRRAAGEGSNVKPADVPDARQWDHWLERLEPSQRAAIVLFHFEQLPYREVADVLGKPVNTVRTLLYRGRQNLREIMMKNAGKETNSWNVAMQNG